MGGIWEAAVKSTKKHLRAVLGNMALMYEDLSTILTQIEACMNSRPLCQLSNSADSYEALTPGHFIINQQLNLLPEPDISHIKEGRLDRWQRIQRHVDDIWARWRNEYVATLQPRNKWQAVQQNLDPGQLVLIKNENTPPAAWELARIVATHPDPYGVVRNVTVRQGEKEYQRPVHKRAVSLYATDCVGAVVYSPFEQLSNSPSPNAANFDPAPKRKLAHKHTPRTVVD